MTRYLHGTGGGAAIAGISLTSLIICIIRNSTS